MGGYPSQVRRGGVPQPGPDGGVGSVWMGGGGGYPGQGGILARSGVGGHPGQVQMGATQGGVCPSRDGVPPPPPWPGQDEGRGYPRWGIPCQGWSTPQPGQDGGVPKVGYPPPPHEDNRRSTRYATGGMPLAFTQEESCYDKISHFFSINIQSLINFDQLRSGRKNK